MLLRPPEYESDPWRTGGRPVAPVAVQYVGGVSQLLVLDWTLEADPPTDFRLKVRGLYSYFQSLKYCPWPSKMRLLSYPMPACVEPPQIFTLTYQPALRLPTIASLDAP